MDLELKLKKGNKENKKLEKYLDYMKFLEDYNMDYATSTFIYNNLKNLIQLD